MPLGSSPRLAAAVSVAIALQLTAAAGALTGPWAVDAPVPVAPSPASVRPAAAVTSHAPVTLAAPGLWAGAVQLDPLSVDAAGALEVPDTADALGWWSAGPRPGMPGAAVVVGHVDLDGRAGVFSRIGRAPAGALLLVDAGSGAVRFRVTSVERYPKSRFPTDVVYRPTVEPELRLITCGGPFDAATGHYEDNVVVRAVRA